MKANNTNRKAAAAAAAAAAAVKLSWAGRPAGTGAVLLALLCTAGATAKTAAAQAGVPSVEVAAAASASAAPSTASGAGAKKPAESLPASYKIKPGDSVEIVVLQKPDLTRTLTILSDGRVSYPYLGEIQAANLTVREFTDRLIEGLSRQLSRPQVTVNVVRRQIGEVSVLGAVRTPGKRAIGDYWRVLDLIADAGGLSVERPEWTQATLVRGGGVESFTLDIARLYAAGDLKQNPVLSAGDILLIQELDQSKTQIQVLGEVARPGMQPAPRDGSLVSVLTAAGGPTARAALSRASLLRKKDGTTVSLDLRGITGDNATGATSPLATVKMEPGDTLLIPQNRLIYSVVGAVGRPGAVEYPESGAKITVLSALALAGGAAANADLKNASLVRPPQFGAAGAPLITPINLEKLLKNDGKKVAAGAAKEDPTLNPLMEPQDMLVIPARNERGGQGFGLRDALSFLPFIGLLGR